MPKQNRVQPTGDIIAHPTRGQFMGNRGILHFASGQLSQARWRHKAWVCCLTEFKGRKRPIMSANRYTELFFYDEAVAFAAGHRPCGECRRPDFNAFLTATRHTGKVAEFDQKLHRARAIPRQFGQRRHRDDIRNLPNGAFILTDDGPALLWADALFPFNPSSYRAPRQRPTGTVTVLTAEPILDALHNGYTPTVRLP
ncbi:hypothetical protein [Shimia abyssi]|uniref:Metal binding Ada-like protein n=1 Tax=Shimia abyssi TaxID=1662395 RepID=A0A2P8FIQ0_9RHOB|nr:hypothetical protein [Shimia abyssi]PSL21591.1 hypothetical protein CLV88_10113 [Shimia abyssi]